MAVRIRRLALFPELYHEEVADTLDIRAALFLCIVLTRAGEERMLRDLISGLFEELAIERLLDRLPFLDASAGKEQSATR